MGVESEGTIMNLKTGGVGQNEGRSVKCNRFGIIIKGRRLEWREDAEFTFL